MFDTNATIVGTIVTQPVRRELINGDQLVTFRMASNSRRLDQEQGEWVDSGTLYLAVTCWRRLVPNVDASLNRGDPILVHGHLRMHQYRTKEGVDRQDLELRARAIGPDLSRCTAQVFRRNAGATAETEHYAALPGPRGETESIGA